MASRGPVLAIDYGTRRLGVAVSDPGTGLAFPAPAIHRTGLRRDLAALRELVIERGIDRVVVGLPIHMDGRAGPEAEAARLFARQIANATGLEVDMLDERWTTREALRSLEETGKQSRRRQMRRSGALDSAAATLLLRTYLEREKATAPTASGDEA